MKIRSLILTVALFAVVNPLIIAETPLPAAVDVDLGSGAKPYRYSLNEIFLPGEGIRAIESQASVTAIKEMLADVIVASKANAFLVLYPAGSTNPANRVILTDEILVEANSAAVSSLGSMAGVQSVEPVNFSSNHYKVTVTNPANTLEMAREIEARPGVSSAQPQIGQPVVKHAVPNDPLFNDQWHLQNTGQFSGAVAGVDVNVVGVWDSYQGQGQIIGIVDDGTDLTHLDLVTSIDRAVSYDFVENDNNPSPDVGDFHGTACAGIAAAAGNNAIGVSGVAPQAKISVIRLLSTQPSYITPVDFATVLNYQSARVPIKSCSFSYANPFVAVDSTIRGGFDNAIKTGRGGKGSIFVISAGNDAISNEDNANYDFLVNHPGTIAVGAIDDKGKKINYSEPGACLVVVAPSGGSSRPQITTTDVSGSPGYSSTDYTYDFNGTSASCPMVSGVVALMLEANPQATWNGIQDVLIRTARKIDPQDPDWTTNAAGLNFNHKYGAGLVDAEAAVAGIKARTSFPQQVSTSVQARGLPLTVPDFDATGITIPMNVNSNIKSLEHVVLKFSAVHEYRGELEVTLTSPSGTASKLLLNRSDTADAYTAWPFMTVRNWGENPNGRWTVKIADRVLADVGRVTGLTLEVYGLTQVPRSSPTGGGGVGNPNVKVAVLEPANRARSSSGSATFRGTAESPSGISRVEYQHLMFANIAEGANHGDPGLVNSGPSDQRVGGSVLDDWLPATGKESWRFTTHLQKGDNRVRIRAIDKDGEISFIKTVSVFVP
jgi:subtilisin family serine protease